MALMLNNSHSRGTAASVFHKRRSVAAALGLSVALFLPARDGIAQELGRVLVLGDSLSAEYGLKRGTGWVALLEQRLAQNKLPYEVVNASISGETSSGGATRLPGLLSKHKPRVVIIELGGNDALRGLDLRATQANLEAMVRASQAIGAQVLLVGMQMPPNYGRAYSEQFASIFKDVARTTKAALVPFFLEGFGEDLRFFQPDRIHPTMDAQPKMLDNVWPMLQPLLKRRL
jgi:acyl-CoA thioesterase-1